MLRAIAFKNKLFCSEWLEIVFQPGMLMKDVLLKPKNQIECMKVIGLYFDGDLRSGNEQMMLKANL